MLKLVVNRARVDLRIEPVTPLLIKSGDKGAAMLHPERPDLMFVRTGAVDAETVYIPGASLKGVVRSSAERVLRTVGALACDPLDHRSRCHKEASELGDDIARARGDQGDPHPQAAVHRMVCFACRTFGSQAIAGRVAFADAYPPAGDRVRVNATERRNGVSIDRRTGGPAPGKLFEMEIVTGGAFETSIAMMNVELWQVGLIGIVLRDIESGFVRLGSAKTRGFGHVRLTPRAVLFEQTDPRRQTATPAGVAVLRRDLVKPYALVGGASDRLVEAPGGSVEGTPLGRRFTFTGPEAWRFLDACAGEPWGDFCARATEAAS